MKLTPEQDTPLQKREELIIPYTCLVCADGTAEWTAYPDAIPYLRPIIDLLEHAPFEAQTLLAVEQSLAPYLQMHGYEREEEDGGRFYETLLAPESFQSSFSHTSMRLTATDFARYENKTEFTFDYDDQIAYATVLDGAVVSLAAENPNSTPQLCEIYTETHPDFRRLGYAISNVAALTQEKIQTGAAVVYRCATDNLPSLQIAKKLGFVHHDYFYCHNAYRMD